MVQVIGPQFLPLSNGSFGCNALTTLFSFIASWIGGPRHRDPFFACFSMDLSVMGGCFVSAEGFVTAVASPACYAASVFDIATFNKLETITSIRSVSCLGFIMSTKALATAVDTS